MASIRCAAEDHSHPTDEVQIETRQKVEILQVSQLVTRVGPDNVGTLLNLEYSQQGRRSPSEPPRCWSCALIVNGALTLRSWMLVVTQFTDRAAKMVGRLKSVIHNAALLVLRFNGQMLNVLRRDLPVEVRMRTCLRSIAVFLMILGAGAVFAGPNDPLLQQGDLEYLGAFRVPSGNYGGSSFDYGGHVLAYNPANDSLYISGSREHQFVAEISIPNIVNSTDLGSLPTATVRQNFADASEGRRKEQDDGNDAHDGGLLVYDGRLYGTVYRFYDASSDTQKRSHYVRPLELSSTGHVTGLVTVGALEAGFVSGYMTHIPDSWKAEMGAPALTGNCCLSIISRTSHGPAAFAFDPAVIGKTEPVPAEPLVYYTSSNPLDLVESTGIYFNGTTEIRGIVFPEGTSSLLFVGRQGIGEFCYGTAEACNDPDSIYHGMHAYPYRTQVWAYDANHLLAVKNGKAQPWSVRPYDVWHFQTPFDRNTPGGAAYDQASARMFIAQLSADGDRPVIVVYRVGQPSGVNPRPMPPSEVKVEF